MRLYAHMYPATFPSVLAAQGGAIKLHQRLLIDYIILAAPIRLLVVQNVMLCYRHHIFWMPWMMGTTIRGIGSSPDTYWNTPICGGCVPRCSRPLLDICALSQNSSPIAVPHSSARSGENVAAMLSVEGYSRRPGGVPSPNPWGPLSHLSCSPHTFPHSSCAVARDDQIRPSIHT